MFCTINLCIIDQDQHYPHYQQKYFPHYKGVKEKRGIKNNLFRVGSDKYLPNIRIQKGENLGFS